ncbi:hypothetical protein K435DRAFT_772704 [Dendrothele bispora CBS 962.96]|uniref:Uncharacterized protein n=1 Tax=Dendrothele bispora (strain CBS 962.96) TaxID=1314807 RepID=A0A4S8MY06_DENBC|nr:hypothetical protein K435DRAFT_772704 [Dendrothele bispora CBS 962.96]
MDQFGRLSCHLNVESVMKQIEEHNTLANKRQIKDAVKKFLIRPDGKKKAYVRLTCDHDALDVPTRYLVPFFYIPFFLPTE